MRIVELTTEQSAQVAAGTHYVCAACGGFFEKGWSEEEANAESKALWGGLADEQLAVICDECFRRGRERGAVPYV